MKRAEKKEMVKVLREKVLASKASILTDFTGLKVKDMNKLRSQLRESGSELKVVKNRLAQLAVKDTVAEPLIEFLKGPNALTFGYDDPVLPVKILHDFAKDFPQLKLEAGIIEGRLFSGDEIAELTKIPGKKVLTAQLLGLLNAPTANFVGVLKAVLGNFLGVLNAIKEKKEAGQ